MTWATLLFLITSLCGTALILLLALAWSRPDLLPDVPWLALVAVAWVLEGVSWYYAIRVYGERGKLRPQDLTIARILWMCGAAIIAGPVLWGSLSQRGLPRG